MTELLALDPDQLLTTTRAVRKRLDLERPVPRDVVQECLDVAFQAPNGSNQQHWNWVIVDDPDTRAEVAEIYRAGLGSHRSKPDSPTRNIDYSGSTQARISESVMYLLDHMHEVPTLVIPTIKGRLDNASIFAQASAWGSVLPAVWSFMLAARSRALGSAWTTLHLHQEERMAEVLGIPYAKHTQVGLFPLAYTIGTEFRPGERDRSDQVVHWNQWQPRQP